MATGTESLPVWPPGVQTGHFCRAGPSASSRGKAAHRCLERRGEHCRPASATADRPRVLDDPRVQRAAAQLESTAAQAQGQLLNVPSKMAQCSAEFSSGLHESVS